MANRHAIAVLILVIYCQEGLAAGEVNALPELPNDAVVLQEKMLPLFSPSVQRWIGETAKGLIDDKIRHSDLQNEIQKRFKEQATNNDFLVSIEFLVLIQATKTLDADIKSMAEKLNLIEKQKIEIINIKSLNDKMRGRLDELKKLSEMTSLRLQTTMDRRSKFISTLSQMVKKITITQDVNYQNVN